MKSEDIAKLAGVSRSTVSRVINNYDNVPEETRLKVMKIIQAYDYHPNAFARTLAGKKSETIGVFFIVEDGKDGPSNLIYNDFYTAYLDAIVDIANERGYYVLVQTVCRDEDYVRVSKAFREKRIDGGIIIGTRQDTLSKIQVDKIKDVLVIFDYELSKIKELHLRDNITILNSDDEGAMEQAVKHIKELGHTSIGFIKGDATALSARQRHKGFKMAMEKFGLTYNADYVIDGRFEQDTTYDAMKQAIFEKRLAQSYICANDYMAIVAMECLREHGILVPEEVSFIGFDNTRTGQLMTPKLTSLTPDFMGMARKAVEIIHMKSTEEETYVPDLIEYKVELIKRDSVSSK